MTMPYTSRLDSADLGMHRVAFAFANVFHFYCIILHAKSNFLASFCIRFKPVHPSRIEPVRIHTEAHVKSQFAEIHLQVKAVYEPLRGPMLWNM